MQHLVVIVGPIASGKSTTAAALGDRFRAAGRAVAVLDLDDFVATIGGFRDLPPERFRQAQIVHGELVGAWLRQGIDVIAHGPIFQAHEQEALLHAVPGGIQPRRVQLLATYDVALERVADDPTRDLSKDPEALRGAYDRARTLLPSMPPSEWTFDTTQLSTRQIVDHLVQALPLSEPRLPRSLDAGHIVLRPLTEADGPALVDAINASLPELQRWFTWARDLVDAAEQTDRLSAAASCFDAGTDYEYGIIERDTGALVGCIRLNPQEAPNVAAIGYWVRSDRHRRGYATSATVAVTRAAFDVLRRIERIEIHMDKANVASTGVPGRAGYVLDREETREILAPGHTGKGWVWVADKLRWAAGK